MLSAEGSESPMAFLFTNMTLLEQYAERVVDYSSKYNSGRRIMYAPENLIGKPAKYPNYGDYPETYMLRTYGKWWNESEGAQSYYMPQDIDPIISEDYVTISFEYAVIPTSISIYETFNPGGIVRIWGKTLPCKWILLWELAPSPGNQTSNVFRPSIKQVEVFIYQLRIEFNQSLLLYHTSIDAILLAGYVAKSSFQKNLLECGLLPKSAILKCLKNELDDVKNEGGCDNFSKLPHEAILQIFQYLDFRSLFRCAQVNQRFYSVSCDSTLYRELSLKRYWHKVEDATLQHLMSRCKQIKKLDLSWCGMDNYISDTVIIEFLQACCIKLTHLSACGCSFVNLKFIHEVSRFRDLTDLRLRNCKGSGTQYLSLVNLGKLTTLDLYSTRIVDTVLINILMSNPDIKHLNIDLCESLTKLDQVTHVVRHHNNKLITWSSWKTYSLTSTGVENLSYCSNLRELDIGWCLMLSPPDNCLERIAIGCKDLRRLIICGWRGVSDHLLLPIIRGCKQLMQLDLLGIKNISSAICERILVSLPKLQLLDISFCDLIDAQEVLIWKEQYPNVTIQHNYYNV